MKKYGIKMSDCKFYVDEANRTVVCVYEDTGDMLLEFIKANLRWKDFDTWFAIDRMEDELWMPDSFRGKAVCAPEDTWNEEIGRKIAYSRMKTKCYKSFFRRANKLVRTIDKRLGEMIDKFNDFGLDIDEKQEALANEIEEYVNGVEE